MGSQPILSESFFSFISIYTEFTLSSLDTEAHLNLKGFPGVESQKRPTHLDLCVFLVMVFD